MKQKNTSLFESSDIKTEMFRTSGLSRTAVKVTHVPSNKSVTCSSERKFEENKQKALKILKDIL